MSLTLIVLAGFYAPDRAAVRYADQLAQALHANLVLLHVNRAALVDPYEMIGESYRTEELALQTDTVAALRRQAEKLRTPATVELTTDLLPAVVQDLAARYGPVLFVLGQPGESQEPATSLTAACVELLRAGQQPLLVVPATAADAPTPRCFLVAADAEPFALAETTRPWRQLLSRLGAEVLVAHVSINGENSAECAAALRAVRSSGLLESLPAPELRGYAQPQTSAGILAAVQETRAEMVVLLARERSYLGELFHRSVTARVLERSPVPVLVLSVNQVYNPSE